MPTGPCPSSAQWRTTGFPSAQSRRPRVLRGLPTQSPAATLRPPASTSRGGQLRAHPPWAPHPGAPPTQAHDLHCPLNTVRSRIPRHREAFLQPHPRPKLDVLPLAKAAATSSCVLPGERVLPTGPWEPGGRKLPPVSSLLRPGPRTKPDAQQRLTIYLPNRAGAPDTRCVGLGGPRSASAGHGKPARAVEGFWRQDGLRRCPGAGWRREAQRTWALGSKGTSQRAASSSLSRPAGTSRGAPDPLSTSGNSVTFDGDRKNRSLS